MRHLALAALLACAAVAFAQVSLTDNHVDLLCPSAGTGDAGNLLASSRYLLRVRTADSALCLASSCADGGVWLPVGTVMEVRAPNTGHAVSCRSAGTGLVHFTLVQ